MEDTPSQAIQWCPLCHPDWDPTKDILETRYCETHEPSRGGIDDTTIIASNYMSGSAEAGGVDNMRWCDFLHRDIHNPPPSVIVDPTIVTSAEWYD